MPTYALLGATGATGSAILRCLLAQPPKDSTLNIFIRSPPKLAKTFPDLGETSAFKVKIIEGTPNTQEALQEALHEAEVIFQCIAANDSKPNTSIAYDTKASVIAALKALKQRQGTTYTKPTILYLRAAPLNEKLSAHEPWLAKQILWTILYHCYKDHERATQLLEATKSEHSDLFDVIYVDPGAIQDADGTERTGYRIMTDEPPSMALSYADLGAAFCELAQRKEEFKGQGVGVVATGKVKFNLGPNLWAMAGAIKGRILG